MLCFLICPAYIENNRVSSRVDGGLGVSLFVRNIY